MNQKEAYPSSGYESPEWTEWDELGEEEHGGAWAVEYFDQEMHRILNSLDEQSKIGSCFIDNEYDLQDLADASSDPEVAAKIKAQFVNLLHTELPEEEWTPKTEAGALFDLAAALTTRLAEQAEIAAEYDDDLEIVSHSQIEDWKRFAKNLGIQYPVTSEQGIRQYVSTDQSNFQKQFLIENGFVDEEEVYQSKLKQLFRGAPIPDSLKTRSPEMRKYWQEQSEQMNGDALEIFLKNFLKREKAPDEKATEGWEELEQEHTNLRLAPVDPSDLSWALDERGVPTDAAFGENSPLIQRGLYHNPNLVYYPSLTLPEQNATMQFISQHADRLESPISRYFAGAAKDVDYSDYDEPDQMSEIISSCKSPQNFTHDGQPNQRFWSEALRIAQTESSVLTRMAGGEVELLMKYSPAQRVYLNLDDGDLVNDINAFVEVELPHDQTFGEHIEQIFDAEGRLADGILDPQYFGIAQAENILRKYPEQIRERFGDRFNDYLQQDLFGRSQQWSSFRYIFLPSIKNYNKLEDQRSFNEIHRVCGKLFLYSLEENGEQRAEDQVDYLCGDFDKFTNNKENFLSEQQKYIIDTYSGVNYYYKSQFTRIASRLDIDDISEEEINEKLMRKYFSDGAWDVFCQGKRWTRLPFDGEDLEPIRRSAVDVYRELNNKHSRELYTQMVNSMDLEKMTVADFEHHRDVIELISSSNAIELRRANIELFQNLADLDNYQEKFRELEDVFLRNNLPYAGKVFRTFQIMQSAPAVANRSGVKHAMERGILSELPSEGGLLNREAVLFTDLLKASVDSNNHSMRQYAESLVLGQDMTDRLSSGELSWDELSSDDRRALKVYVDHLGMMSSQTQNGRAEKWKSSGDLRQDLADLEKLFGTTKRHNLANRAVRSFGYALGIRSANELLERMDAKVAMADARGRERYLNNDFSIHEGDLVKAVEQNYLFDLLQNGVVCKEFLNGETSSDATPLDADVTQIGAGVNGTVSSAIEWKNADHSFVSTPINLVLKHDERFVTEKDERESRYDPEKFALWSNYGSNYGVRVGFPSSAIDFITYDTESAHSPSYLFSVIAKNGFYIPVVDQHTGNCIFSPDDFDQLRRTLSGVEYYGGGEFQFANDEDLVAPDTGEIAKELITHNQEIASQSQSVFDQIQRILFENYPNLRGLRDGVSDDLAPGYMELINTGSTGRGTSTPGSKVDFDYIMRVDADIYNDRAKKSALEQALRAGLPAGKERTNSNGLRLTDVEIPGIERPVDIDISFVQRTNRMEFSSDQAMSERLDAMRAQDPVRYQLVLANIVKAKGILKQADAYKPRTSSDTDNPDEKGGLGGVGVENWIVQHGGSLVVAAKDFLAAADAADGDWQKFAQSYAVWDAGQNHFAVRNNETSAETVDGSQYYEIPFSNFVANNMDAGGFSRMTEALRQYLAEVENPGSVEA